MRPGALRRPAVALTTGVSRVETITPSTESIGINRAPIANGAAAISRPRPSGNTPLAGAMWPITSTRGATRHRPLNCAGAVIWADRRRVRFSLIQQAIHHSVYSTWRAMFRSGHGTSMRVIRRRLRWIRPVRLQGHTACFAGGRGTTRPPPSCARRYAATSCRRSVSTASGFAARALCSCRDPPGDAAAIAGFRRPAIPAAAPRL